MRYVITQTQFHDLIYKFLNAKFKEDKFKKHYNEDGETIWRIDMLDENGDDSISFFWHEPGLYDDGETLHNGIGNLHIHPTIVDSLRTVFKVRENKIMDIIADWVSEKLNVDIDEITLYPYRQTPTVY